MGTPLQIRPLDVHDDVALHRFHEIGWRAEMQDGRPWNSFWTCPELASMLREPTGDMASEAYAAWGDAGRMVGFGLCELPLLDNTEKGYLCVAVEPESRGRGIGGALLETLVARAAARDRSLVLADAALPIEQRETSPVLRFAKDHGFSPANLEIYRVLRLPVRPGVLDTLRNEAAAHHAGTTVETYVDELPASYLPTYTHLVNQLIVDAPTGDVDFEAERLTPEILTQKMERAARIGRTTYRSVAVRDGEVVAHSDLVVMSGQTYASQWGTLVRRDHRGHRLGTAVKVANLAALQATRPEVTDVRTQNAETNQWMVDINVRLGFEPVGICPEFVRSC